MTSEEKAYIKLRQRSVARKYAIVRKVDRLRTVKHEYMRSNNYHEVTPACCRYCSNVIHMWSFFDNDTFYCSKIINFFDIEKKRVGKKHVFELAKVGSNYICGQYKGYTHG